MPVIELPIAAPVYRNTDASVDKAIEQRINCYVDEKGNVNKDFGLSLFLNLNCGPLAGLYWWYEKNYLIAVSLTGRTFKITSASGAYTEITGTSFTVNGKPVTFAENNTYLLMANGASKPMYTNGTANTALITDSNCPANVTHVRYLGGFFACNAGGTFNFQPSDVNAITFNNAQVNQKTQQPDPIIAMETLIGYLYVFGTRSTEVWQIGAGTNILNFYYYIERGCIAPYSIVNANNSLFFLDHTRRIIKLVNNMPEIVSTPYDLDFQQLSTVSDCIGNLIEVNGRPQIMWSFPSDGRAFIFDFLTNQWRERYSFNISKDYFAPYICNHHAWCPTWGLHIFSSSIDGRLYTGDGYFDENGNPVRTLILTGNSDYADEKLKIPSGVWKTCDWIEIWAKRGYGTQTTLDSNGDIVRPKLMIRWMDDFQPPWSDYITIDLGLQGNTETVQRVYGLGRFMTRQWEITTTDPVPYVLSKIRIGITPGY